MNRISFCISSILFLFSLSECFAQIYSNISLNYSIDYDDSYTDLYKYNQEDISFKNTDSTHLGFDINFNYQNEANTQYQIYNDNLHYLVSPYLHLKFNKQFSFDVRVNIENIKAKFQYPGKFYWADDFLNHRGGFEIAKITYENDYLFVKFGRDYFIPGIHLYENLLFSKYNYPYDQLKIAFRNEYFELSTFYLSLNSFAENNTLFQRHLNGHRLSIDIKYGYIAFNDIMLYGGQDRQIELALFNPLLLYYPYQKNKKHFESNSLMSFELYLQYKNYFLFGEFLIDDFQVDKKVPGDLEPAEYGINITFGKNSILQDYNWKMNYTKVANRTFNAPEKDYEKYIYKNYPIGHFLGNNFWEIKSTLEYKPKNKFCSTKSGLSHSDPLGHSSKSPINKGRQRGVVNQKPENYFWDKINAEITFYYYEYGDEALYSDFNKDYLDFTIEEGYSENFPYGKTDTQYGFYTTVYYNLTENIILRNNLSYWPEKGFLENNFNYSFGIAYHY